MLSAEVCPTLPSEVAVHASCRLSAARPALVINAWYSVSYRSAPKL